MPAAPAPDLGDAPLAAVHDPAMLALLATAWARWQAAGLPGEAAIPYLFPAVAGLHGGTATGPIHVALGRYCADTLTPVGPGTWAAARSSAHAAAHAADLVTDGGGRVFAATRPPGHHAGRAFFGGSCYVNHAAVAAARLRASGAGRVAVLDLDAHHANGTRAIFWGDAAVLVASVHVDPAAGWYPHTVGGGEPADPAGTSLDLPVPPGSGDAAWLAAVDLALGRVAAFAPDALVLSLGVDAAAEDPNSPLRVTRGGFAAAGERLAALPLPTVAVLEGGYVPETLGGHVRALLGLGSGSRVT